MLPMMEFLAWQAAVKPASRRAASELAIAVGAAFVMLGAVPVAASDLCGMTITADLDLDHDLSCSGNGLTVGADGIRIRLNGHMISGPGCPDPPACPAVSPCPPSVGITVSGRTGVTILGPGTVTNFRTGVLIASSSDVDVKGLDIVANGVPRSPCDTATPNDGIRATDSTRIHVRGNDASGNGDDGVNLVGTSDSDVTGNAIDDNGHDGVRLDSANDNHVRNNSFHSEGDFVAPGRGCGIEVFASNRVRITENEVTDTATGVRIRAFVGTTPVPATENRIVENIVTGSSIRGIHLDGSLATGNRILENQVRMNCNGIEFGRCSGGCSGGSSDGQTPFENDVKENVLSMNTCAVRGSSASLGSNTFDDNVFLDNTNDTCVGCL